MNFRGVFDLAKKGSWYSYIGRHTYYWVNRVYNLYKCIINQEINPWKKQVRIYITCTCQNETCLIGIYFVLVIYLKIIQGVISNIHNIITVAILGPGHSRRQLVLSFQETDPQVCSICLCADIYGEYLVQAQETEDYETVQTDQTYIRGLL